MILTRKSVPIRLIYASEAEVKMHLDISSTYCVGFRSLDAAVMFQLLIGLFWLHVPPSKE